MRSEKLENEAGNLSICRNHRKYSITKIDQNTEKSSGDLVGFVSNTPVKDNQQTLV